MTTQRHEGPDLDELLRKAFADDLPADIASGMKDQIDRFRAVLREDESRKAAWRWIFRRSAWAALSILMLVSGSLLQGLGSRNALADRISQIEIRQAVMDRLAAAVSMSCSARVRNERGGFSSVEIMWRSGGVREIRPGASGGSPDARLRDTASFSSPEAVRALLGGAWRPVGIAGEAGRETGAFTTQAGAAGERLEFTIDLGTFYPVRAALLADGSAGTGNIIWEARFAF